MRLSSCWLLDRVVARGSGYDGILLFFKCCLFNVLKSNVLNCQCQVIRTSFSLFQAVICNHWDLCLRTKCALGFHSWYSLNYSTILRAALSSEITFLFGLRFYTANCNKTSIEHVAYNLMKSQIFHFTWIQNWNCPFLCAFRKWRVTQQLLLWSKWTQPSGSHLIRTGWALTQRESTTTTFLRALTEWPMHLIMLMHVRETETVI